MAPGTRSPRRKRSKGPTPFPWMELDFDMQSVVISKVAPDNLVSLIVAIEFPGPLPPAGSSLSDSFRDQALALKFLTSEACEGSDIVASAGYFDFEARCAALWKRSPETLTASFHRDATAGYVRKASRDVARLAELGSFKRRCALLPTSGPIAPKQD
jgi:hypothetical protein